MDMSEVFWSMFLTTSVAFVLAIGRLCYKSKCSSVEICCFKIIRNIEMEEKEDELEMKMKAEKGQNNNDNQV